MFFIRKNSDSGITLSPETHKDFLKKCEAYINRLKSENKLIEAQPIVRQGSIISLENGSWQEIPFNQNNEIIGGYYHILANDIAEAISIAKDNPEFEYNADARIEVRPLKMKEEITGYIYPTGG